MMINSNTFVSIYDACMSAMYLSFEFFSSEHLHLFGCIYKNFESQNDFYVCGVFKFFF